MISPNITQYKLSTTSSFSRKLSAVNVLQYVKYVLCEKVVLILRRLKKTISETSLKIEVEPD